MTVKSIEMMKIALSACIAMLTTGATSWMVFGQDKVSRSEMRDYVQTQSPWNSEGAAVKLSVAQNSKDIGQLTVSVNQLVSSQNALLVEQRVLNEQVRQLVEHGR